MIGDTTGPPNGRSGTAGPNADAQRTGTTVLDVGLFKKIGLHQLLWPPAGSRFRTALLAAVCVAVCLELTRFVQLFRLVGDPKRFAHVSMLTQFAVVSLYKGYVLVTRADEMRDVLDAADFGFTACGQRNPAKLLRRQAVLFTWLRPFVAANYGITIVWIVQPWMTTTGEHRPWTVGWMLHNAAETVMSSVNLVCWTQFDSYLVTSCYTLNAQFRSTAVGYRLLGHNNNGDGQSRTRKPSPSIREVKIVSDVGEEDMSKSENHSELILHIKDNQKIIQKYDELLNIISPVILVQMCLGLYSVVTIILLTLLEFTTSRSAIFQYFIGFVLIAGQLYIICFAINYLITAKSEVNFGLYSSNWTGMDLKFKKTLLLTMQMNNAHRRVIKISPLYVVNLEMFSQVMKTSYSTASVLLNMITKQKNE